MTGRLLASAILGVFLISSCAPKAGVKKPEELQAEVEKDKFVLPPPPPAPPKTVKQPPRERPPTIELAEEDKFIMLNFENTDIQTIISTFGELLGINYILTPGITGSVTVQSYKKFPVDNMFQIFQTLLEINGLTAIKDGEFYRIIPIDTAKQQPLEVEKGRDVSFALDSSFVTHLIPLDNVKASDTANILRNLMSRGTDLVVYEPANMLIVTAQPATLMKFIKIVEALDLPETESESIRTFVYYVENGKAITLQDILKTVYADSKATSVTKAAATTRAPARRTTTAPAPQPAPAQALPGELGEITITAYEDINALLIKCTPRTYLSLLEVLKKIDVPPKQVLIEVLIAEVTLSDSMQYGLQWLTKTKRGDTFGFTSSTIENPPIITTSHPGSGNGILAAVVSGVVGTTDYNYVVSALASATEVNVLANPTILVMDNKDAEIKIGKEVPTATSTTESSEGTTTSSQIEYKTVGTILNVTPHITEKGNVSMKITVEKSDTGTTTTLGSGTYPNFTTNKATTSAVVEDGHTLIIGGLIDHKKNKERSGIPILSKIPVLGYFFSTNSQSIDKTELILMVTPHVIDNQKDADRISMRFHDSVNKISRKLKRLGNWKGPSSINTDNTEDAESHEEEAGRQGEPAEADDSEE